MRKITCRLIVMASMAWLIHSLTAFGVERDETKAPPERTDDAAEIGRRTNAFALDLYRQLSAAGGNLVFSPVSVSSALSMTYAGAAGVTKNEMARVLHLESSNSQLQNPMGAVEASWKAVGKKPGFRLHNANRLWGQDNYSFLPEFLAVTRNRFGAELGRVDFKQPGQARQRINQWVEDHTDKKIPQLIGPADDLGHARLVLTNALYFQGDWAAAFEKTLTKEDEFRVTARHTVKAPLMQKQDDFAYVATDGLQLIELRYGHGEQILSMLVLLPERVDGLQALERRMTMDNLDRWSRLARSREVLVYLPKFKARFAAHLKGALESMGMVSAFDEWNADFSGMTGRKELCVSEVIHQAVIDVNESGTEAAAATAVVVSVPVSATLTEPEKPPVFRADHPFVFIIRDNRTAVILFMGRIVDPTL